LYQSVKKQSKVWIARAQFAVGTSEWLCCPSNFLFIGHAYSEANDPKPYRGEVEKAWNFTSKSHIHLHGVMGRSGNDDDDDNNNILWMKQEKRYHYGQKILR
jgi:hypothetical protein